MTFFLYSFKIETKSEENPEGDLSLASDNKETEGLSIDMKILKSIVQSFKKNLLR